MISDNCALEIARRLLEQHGMSDDVIQSAALLVKTIVELDDCNKRIAQAAAGIQLHGFLADTFKGLPG